MKPTNEDVPAAMRGMEDKGMPDLTDTQSMDMPDGHMEKMKKLQGMMQEMMSLMDSMMGENTVDNLVNTK